METKNEVDKKEKRDTLATVLFWAGWCFVGIAVFIVIGTIFMNDYPSQINRFTIIYWMFQRVTSFVFHAFILFAASAIIRTTNANALELRKLRSEQKQ